MVSVRNALTGYTHRYLVRDPVSIPFRNYPALEVGEFATTLADEEAKQLANDLPRLLIEKLGDDDSDARFSEITRSTAAERGVLVVHGNLTSYEKGSRARRYLIGFGAGNAYTTVECTFVYKVTGDQIAKATFDGELSMGLFGGSSDEAAGGVLDAIVDCLEDYF